MKHWWLYVLKLEDDKWYVGISTDVDKRYKQHLVGFASPKWTKDHKPLEVFDRHNLGTTSKERAELYEKRVTRKYIKKYGLDNVRGSDLSKAEDYVQRFGYFHTRDSWQAVSVITLLLFIIIFLVIRSYVST